MESKHQVMFNSTIAYLILKGKKVTPPQNIKVKKQMKKDDLFIFKHGFQTLGKYHTNQQIYVILKHGRRYFMLRGSIEPPDLKFFF